MLFAIVPAAPPTRKNQRTTSCPAPISANVPYQRGSRLILSAFEWVSMVSSFTSQQISPVFRALNVQAVHQSAQGKAPAIVATALCRREKRLASITRQNASTERGGYKAQ